jgi:hypothetical protein
MSCFYLFLASRNGGSSRDYPIGSPVYRTDPYRTSSAIPIPSSYVPRDQYTQSFSSIGQEIMEWIIINLFRIIHLEIVVMIITLIEIV